MKFATKEAVNFERQSEFSLLVNCHFICELEKGKYVSNSLHSDMQE